MATLLSPLTPRDVDLLQALERTPLTVRQILRLSVTFAYPFTTERRVQERLEKLAAAGRVRRWLYATAGQGALGYYTLSPLGAILLRGTAETSRRRRFGPVGVARQRHTHALAEAIVAALVATHRDGLLVQSFSAENTLRLRLASESLFPDCAFTLVTPDGRTFRFMVELDNCTESIRSDESLDAWQRKVGFYERLQDSQADRFRVLVVTTGQKERLGHILDCAKSLARNPQRSLVYGACLADFLAADDPLRLPCFRNHRGQPVALVPALAERAAALEFSPAVMLPSSSCMGVFPKV